MTDNKQPLIILTGPTAVGKTSLSVKLAHLVGGEIISADSMQVYRGMDIGSAKVTLEEMDGIPHYLINEFDPAEEFHVVKFQEYARNYIKKISDRGKIPILVGGTGFYIQAVLYNIDFTENGNDTAYRNALEQIVCDQGAEVLHEMLRTVDPVSAKLIHANNVKRTIRALEYYHETGERISNHNEEERQRTSPYNFVYFVLNEKRSQIYQKIDRRVDRMMEQGLLEEVTDLKNQGCTRTMVSMQGLGYKEILAFLEGSLPLEEAVRIIKRDTRHFAKRQLTWFRRERDVVWVNKDDFNQDDTLILDYMKQILKEKRILI